MATAQQSFRVRDSRIGALRKVLIAGALALLVQLQTTPAGAEARVEGTPDAVRIEAHDASLEEVFSALGAAFELRYKTRISLDRRVNGSFSGSLSQVISRLLPGYDYVVRRTGNAVEVVILGKSRTSSTLPNLLAPPKGTPLPAWLADLIPPEHRQQISPQ